MGFAARAALLFALVPTTLGANRKQNGIVRLLEQMRASAGPVWGAHIVSISRLTFEGTPAVVSSESQAFRVIIRHCTGELCDGTYFDGERLYSFNMNGTALPQSLREPALSSGAAAGRDPKLSVAFVHRARRPDRRSGQREP